MNCRLSDIIDWVLQPHCAFCNCPPYAIYRSRDGEEIITCREHGKAFALKMDTVDPDSLIPGDDYDLVSVRYITRIYKFVGKVEPW